MEWTREKTLILIEEYRKRPGLWDMTHEDYRKKEIKKELLDQVAKIFDRAFPLVEIEKKFHTLRTQFHREVHRMKQGRGTDYKSKWFAFKHLEFLSSPKACRSSRSTPVKIKIEKAESNTSAITTGEEDDDQSPPTKYVIKSVPVTTYTTIPAHIQAEFITATPKNHKSSNSSVTKKNIDIEGPAPPKLQRAPTNKPRPVKEIRCITRKELETLIEDATKNMDEQSESEMEQTVVQTTGIGETSNHQHMIIKDITVPGNLSTTGYNNSIAVTELHRVIQTGVNAIETDHQTEELIDDTPHLSDSSNIHDDNNSYNHHHTIKIAPQRQQNHHQQQQQQQQQQQPQQQQQKQQQRSDQQQQIYEEIQYEDQTHNHSQSQMTSTPSSQQHSVKKIYYEKVPVRDEFAIFGEYVANELRFITNKDILVTAKHKINVTLFEACTSQLNRLE